MADCSRRTYVLVHKNVSVAETELDDASASISAIGELYEKSYVPFGITVNKGRIDREGLNDR